MKGIHLSLKKYLQCAQEVTQCLALSKGDKATRGAKQTKALPPQRTYILTGETSNTREAEQTNEGDYHQL